MREEKNIAQTFCSISTQGENISTQLPPILRQEAAIFPKNIRFLTIGEPMLCSF